MQKSLGTLQANAQKSRYLQNPFGKRRFKISATSLVSLLRMRARGEFLIGSKMRTHWFRFRRSRFTRT